MAEGFAQRFGKDVMQARSAGIMPAGACDPMTVASMKERGIPLDEDTMTSVGDFAGEEFDICVSFGCADDEAVKAIRARERRDWGDIEDPAGKAYADFRRTREEVGRKVLALIRELRETV
jgi:arsenate reductase